MSKPIKAYRVYYCTEKHQSGDIIVPAVDKKTQKI